MEPRQTLEPWQSLDPIRQKQRLLFESTNSLHNTLAPEAPANESATGFANDEYLVGILVEWSTETPRGLLIKKILPPESKQFPVSDGRRSSAPSRMENTPQNLPIETGPLNNRRNSLGKPLVPFSNARPVNAMDMYIYRKSPHPVKQQTPGNADNVSVTAVVDGNPATAVNVPNEEEKPSVPSQPIQNIAQGNRTNPLIIPKRRTPATGTGKGGYASRRSSRPGMGGAADAPRHQFTVRRR